MNHSILVVICDFLVLSVLSLSLGVAPVNSSYTGRGTRIDDYTANILLDELKAKIVQLNKMRQNLLEAQRKLGFAETRSKQVKELNEQLAHAKSRLNYLESKLEKRGGEIGKLSKEQLLLRLEKESIRRLKVMTEMSEAKSALEFEKAKNTELEKNMSALRQDVMRRDDELTEKKTLLEERTERLQKLTAEFKDTESALDSTKGELKKKSTELASSLQDLSSTKSRLSNIALELKNTRTEAKATLQDLFYIRGQLNATEKELAESRSSLSKRQKAMAINEFELREAREKIASLQKILKNAVGDLSRAQEKLNLSKQEKEQIVAELSETRLDLAKTSSKEKATQQALKKIKDSLSDAMHKLKSDALERYSQAAVYLKLDITEKRFLMDYSKERVFYLPEINIEGKTYLVSSMDLLSGMGRVINEASKINKLSYSLGKPKDGKKLTPANTQLLSLNIDNRVGLLEIPSVRKNSLELLGYNELRKRGIQDLTLFKYSSFGKESSGLDGRCSLGLDKGDHYLYIRNSVPRNAPALKAEVGDFIISKEGKLVAVAVAVEVFDLGRRERVKCFVFPDDFKLSEVSKVPLSKAAGKEYYQGFVAAVAAINSRIKDIERKK